MKFGLLLTSTDAESPQRQFERHLRMVGLAEECGFETIVASHHFLSDPYAYFQPVPLLCRLSAETSLRLATGVLLLPMLNPVEIAESFATLDVLSGGRSIFGVGIGYRPSEFENLGVRQGERGARFEEALNVILALWGNDSPIDFDGRFFSLRGAHMTMRPLQQPTPPLWVAGMADAAVERAGRMGGSWYVNPNASMETMRRQLTIWRNALAAAGHSEPEYLPVRREAFVAPDGAQAKQRALELVSERYKVYGQWNIRANLPESERAAHDDARAATELPGDGRFIVGDPAECARTLVQIEESTGTSVDVVFRVQWPGITEDEIDRTIRLLGTEVLPMTRELARQPVG